MRKQLKLQKKFKRIVKKKVRDTSCIYHLKLTHYNGIRKNLNSRR